jgi:hypothetical protein
MNDAFDRIFFDDTYVQDLVRLYDQAQDRLRAIQREIAKNERILGSSPDERAFSEAFADVCRDLQSVENATAILLRKIREIKGAYTDAELKNMRLVNELVLPRFINTHRERGVNGGYSGHLTEIDRIFSGMSVGRGGLLRRNSVTHEDWLVEMAEME